MTEPAYRGHCLNCGRVTYAQEYCDNCWSIKAEIKPLLNEYEAFELEEQEKHNG